MKQTAGLTGHEVPEYIKVACERIVEVYEREHGRPFAIQDAALIEDIRAIFERQRKAQTSERKRKR